MFLNTAPGDDFTEEQFNGFRLKSITLILNCLKNLDYDLLLLTAISLRFQFETYSKTLLILRP